jgi:uncharacterized membrane protein (DUF2068 family)
VAATTGRNTVGFRLIGALKLATALLLAAAAFGIFRLLNKDLGEALQHFVTRLHLDPENQLVQAVGTGLAGIDRTHLKALGVGTFFYAALELVEGVGLILERRWAHYLTIFATALLLIPELYELSHKINVVRGGVLLSNVIILIYLIVKLRQEQRSTDGPGTTASLSDGP